MADILSQVGIKVTADTRQAIEAFRALERAEGKVGEASAFIGKISASVDKVMIPLLGLQTAFLAVNTAVQLASSAVKIWNDLWEEGEWDGSQFEQTLNTFKRLEDAAKGGAQWMDSFWAVANKLAVLEMESGTVTKGIISRLTELGRVAPNFAYIAGQLGKARESVVRAEAAALAESEAAAEAHADIVKRVQDEREARLRRDAAAYKKAQEDLRQHLLELAAITVGENLGLPTEDELRDAFREFYGMTSRVAAEEFEAASRASADINATLERDTGGAYTAEDGKDPRLSQFLGTGAGGDLEKMQAMSAAMRDLGDITTTVGASFYALSESVTAAMDAMLGSDSAGDAVKRMFASVLRALGARATAEAKFEAAAAIASGAIGDVRGALGHGAAAVGYLAASAAAGYYAGQMGGSGSGGGGSSGYSSAGGGYIGPRQTGGDGGTQVTIIVQGDVNDGNALAEKVERATRRAIASGRVRGGGGSQMVERV